MKSCLPALQFEIALALRDGKNACHKQHCNGKNSHAKQHTASAQSDIGQVRTP
ncbi:MAG TPA: hypothetical protein VIJ85_04775 [Rhizomicrobium sp.]